MPPRVLVVEDEADLATTCARLLRWQGYEVVCANSRQAALWAIYGEPFVLVITDLRLPDGDGLDVVRAARRTSTPTPVIVFTGFVSEPSRRAAIEAGASTYLVKPFSVEAFRAAIRKTLGSAAVDAGPPGAARDGHAAPGSPGPEVS